jgi:hypothetical protein
MKQILATILLVLIAAPLFAQPGNFSTSLHATRNGKGTWYNAENGGYETLTGVPIEQLGCVECHGPTDANGNPYPEPYVPACSDCHKTDFSVEVSQCLSCHGRQAAEINVHQFSDVHRDSNNPAVDECWDCHPTQDVHGNGTEHMSMFDVGAINADCEDCHPASGLPASHAANDPHGGVIHCSSCHAQAVISCYNCHFESQVQHHVKRAKQQITNFTLLVNRTSDGKVHPASFQSLSYQGNTWIAIGPYSPHNITKNGKSCADCHVNFGGQVEAILDYNADGIMQFSTWNSSDSTLSWLKGVVPLPEDYQRSFKLDFITFNGDPSSPPGTDNKNWSFVEGDWDGHQLLYATAFTKAQMAKLGFDTTLTSVKPELTGEIPSEYKLEQNYPNPFNPSTTIKYSIPEQTHVLLRVYNSIGEVIETLVNVEQSSGVYTVGFNGGNLSSGVYFCQIQTDSYTATKKLILMK